MKLILLCVAMILIGALVSGFYFDHRVDVLIERERNHAQNISSNLNYEIMAHEQDVDLLKHENNSLRVSCTP